jgi:hypothetical protein
MQKLNPLIGIAIILVAIPIIWLFYRVSLMEIGLSQLTDQITSISQKQLQSTDKEDSATSNKTPIISETGRFIIATDQGFLSSSFEANAGDKLNLSISNQGKNSHSFNIDSLNIKTGPIEAGKTVKVSSINIPADKTTLNYYSDTNDDAKNDAFKGIINIIKN